ncbi:MAG: hypothetical protein AABN34_00305 [Acidobacteriota bacterium]
MTGTLKVKRTATVIILFLLGLLIWLSLTHFRTSEIFGSREGNQTRVVSSGYDPPVHLANLENRSVLESSGIGSSKLNTGVFWTHNDSGDGPFLYAFDQQGKNRGVWRVAGASAVDWEDMAMGPGPIQGQSYIYAGDIGDNSKDRDEILVYRVAEPSIASSDSSSTTKSPRNTDAADVIRLRYPDGKHNAETLLVHPSTGDLYIITKLRGAAAGVYKLKAPFSNSGPSTLVRIGEVQFPNSLKGLITGGDISPDGKRVILCDYLGGCELVLPATQGIAFDEIWKQPLMQVNVGARKQGEAICYRADGLALMATSEGLPCPLIETARSRRE